VSPFPVGRGDNIFPKITEVYKLLTGKENKEIKTELTLIYNIVG
jgi:hypothetical protein